MLRTEIRAAFRTVSPFIIHERAPELVEFLKRTFDAEEVRRDTTEKAYGFYAEVKTGDSVLMIGGGSAAEHGNLPGAFHVFVDDCDAAYRRALEAGATTLMGAMGEPADRPYGERSAFVEDAFGKLLVHRDTPLVRRGVPKTCSGFGIGGAVPAPGRRTKIHRVSEGGVRGGGTGGDGTRGPCHARLRSHRRCGAGDGRTGEPGGDPVPGGFFVRVDDVETAYAKALAAGGTVVRPPDDIPYGYRSAIVKDPAGFLWWTAKLLTR